MRQQQPPDPSVDDFDEVHRHIPRDADGSPVFLILPTELQAEHDEHMAQCEAGWRETGDPAFVGEAVSFTNALRQPVPRWLSDAVLALTIECRSRPQTRVSAGRSSVCGAMALCAMRMRAGYPGSAPTRMPWRSLRTPMRGAKRRR